MTNRISGRVAAAFVAGLTLLGSAGCDDADTLPEFTAASRAPSSAVPRAEAVLAAAERIRGECDRNAGGDWAAWDAKLAPYRASLSDRIAAAKPLNPKSTVGSWEVRCNVLEARGDFDLFEPAPAEYLQHVLNPEILNALRAEKPVVAASRWLRERGIELIFVPVPKMTEVYPDLFADHCPADRVVSPVLRRALLEMLEADVEVLDMLPLLLAERGRAGEALYQPADPHWAPRGQAIAARELAARLRRIPELARAAEGPRVIEDTEVAYRPADHGSAYLALTPAQQRRADAAQPKLSHTASRVGGGSVRAPQSPVVVIGDSFNEGMVDYLADELNTPLQVLSAGSQTSHAFKEFVRDPERLRGVKAVVWVLCTPSLRFPMPLPAEVSATLKRK